MRHLFKLYLLTLLVYFTAITITLMSCSVTHYKYVIYSNGNYYRTDSFVERNGCVKFYGVVPMKGYKLRPVVICGKYKIKDHL